MKILLIEPNADVAFVSKMRFEHDGHIVTVAGNAPDALYAVRNMKFDIYLIDWGIPPSGGLILLSKLHLTSIRQHGQKATAVAWYASVPDKWACAPYEFDSFLLKPIGFEHIYAAFNGQVCSKCRSSYTIQNTHTYCSNTSPALTYRSLQ